MKHLHEHTCYICEQLKLEAYIRTRQRGRIKWYGSIPFVRKQTFPALADEMMPAKRYSPVIKTQDKG